MKFNKNRASRAVAYVMSAIMISQALLSPTSMVYANADDDTTARQETAQVQNSNGECASAENSADGQDAGDGGSEVNAGTTSTETAPASSDAAAAVDAAAATSSDADDAESDLEAASSAYNPNADPLVITETSAKQEGVSASAGFYLDADHTQPLGSTPVGQGDTVYADVSIKFAGKLYPSLEHPNIEYDFPTNNKVAEKDGAVYNNAGELQYTWEIKDNKLYVRYSEEFLTTLPSNITAEAKFTFSIDAGGTDDSGVTKVTFPGSGTVVDIVNKEGNISGSKAGKLNDDGSSMTFTIDLDAQTKATNVVLTDKLGSSLSFDAGSFMLDGEKLSSDRVGIDGQQATVNIGDLPRGKHKLTYIANIDQSALDAANASADPNAALSNIDNHASWTWTGNADGNSADSWSSLSYKMVSKSGKKNGDGSYTWTVTLNSGDLKADMAGYEFKDKLGDPEHMSYDGTFTVIDVTDGGKVIESAGKIDAGAGSFSYTFPSSAKDHEYRIVYTTTVSGDAPFGNYANTASVDKDGGKHGTSMSTVSVAPDEVKNLVSKDLVSAADGEGYASWSSTIELSKLSQNYDAGNFTFTDQLRFGDDWWPSAIWFVDGEGPVLSYGDGQTLVKDRDYTVSYERNGDHAVKMTITFNRDSQTVKSLLGKRDLTVSYRTRCDLSEGTYYNRAAFNDGWHDQQDEASYRHGSNQAVVKDGNLVWDADFDWSKVDPSDTSTGAWVANWTVTANYEHAAETNWGQYGKVDLDGEPIEIEDTLPQGMSFVPGSAEFELYNDWTAALSGKIDAKVADGKLNVTIPTTVSGKDNGHPYWTKVTYRTASKAAPVDMGSQDGTQQVAFTNSVTAKAGAIDLGSDSKTLEGTQSVVKKTVDVKSDSQLAKYQIVVNEQAQDLAEGRDTLVLTDKFTGRATLVASSVQVLDAQGKALDKGLWGYVVSNYTDPETGATGFKTVFTVPDQTALKIVYSVKPQGLDKEEVPLSNYAELEGEEAWHSGETTSFTVVDSDVISRGEASAITITKVDGADRSKIDGVRFALYKVDAGVLTPGALESDQRNLDIKNHATKVSEAVTKDGKATFGSAEHPLETDQLYYFVEEKAAPGYEADDTITCFVIKGTSEEAYDKYVSALDKLGVSYSPVRDSTEAGFTRYNTPTSEAQTEFRASKILKGKELSRDEFAFVAIDAQGNEVARGTNDAEGNVTLKGDGLSWDKEGTFTYTIKEAEGEEVGVSYSDESYKAVVTVKRDGTYGPLRATVEYQNADGTKLDANTLPTFTNTYKKPEVASVSTTLKVKKLVNGGSAVAADRGFTFSLYKAGEDGKPAGDELAAATAKPGQTVDFDNALSFSEAGTYQYVIEETSEAGNGLTNADTVIATVVVEAAQDGALSVKPATYSNATEKDGTGAALFDNTYEAKGCATVKVQKTVNGEAPASGQAFDFALTPVDGAPMPGGAESLTATTAGDEAASFPELKYALEDAGKTYTYTISETTPATIGWTMAGPVTVTVTVGADRGDGTLGAATVTYSNPNADGSAALFNNRYEQASGEFQLGLVKTVNGETPLKGETFEFSAMAEGDNAKEAPKLENVTTGANGAAAFKAVKLSDKDTGKTYTYRIHEVTDLKGGNGAWTKAADVIATVEVSGRSANNMLTATVTYRGADGLAEYAGAAQFDNAFKPTAVTAPIRVKKASVNGRADFKANETYTFGLYNKGADGEREGKAIATVSGKLGNVLTFSSDKLAFSRVGTYEYLIHEETHNGEDGWGDVADIPVTVTVTAQGGTGSDARDLKATVAYDGSAKADHAPFADTYTASGSATLKVNKVVNGGEDKAEDEKFEFVLKDASGKELSHASAAAGETAAFAPIGYTLDDAGKTFTYQISELGHDSGRWFKAGDVTATVKVTDNGDGTLKTEVIYSSASEGGKAALFDNTHAAPAEAELKVSKTVNGAKEDAAKEKFAFELKADKDGTPMPESAELTIDGTGTGSFGKISYSEPGTYVYTIHETSDLGDGWTNAGDVTATVTVERDERAKMLKVTGIEYSNPIGDKTAAAFDNTYKAKGTEVSLKAVKVLKGGELKAGQFEFQLKDANGKVLQTVENDKDGNISFDPISYVLSDLDGRDSSRDFGYTISEVVPEGAVDGVKDGVTYDTAEHKVKVHVSDDGASGRLEATVTYDGKAEAPVFTNIYTPKEEKPHGDTPRSDAPKDDAPKGDAPKGGRSSGETSEGMPTTGDTTTMVVSIIATAGLCALASGLRLSRRKRSDR